MLSFGDRDPTATDCIQSGIGTPLLLIAMVIRSAGHGAGDQESLHDWTKGEEAGILRAIQLLDEGCLP